MPERKSSYVFIPVACRRSADGTDQAFPVRWRMARTIMHGGGDNSARQNALTDSVQVTLISQDMRASVGVQQKHVAHREYPALHDRYTFPCCRASDVASTERKKTGCRTAVGEYAWLHHR